MWNKIITATGILGVLAYLGVIFAALYGWGHNIYSLATHVGAWGVVEIVRVVGIVVFPIGAVMGYVG